MTVPWFCSVADSHDLDAGQHHVAGTQVAHDFVDPRAADDIGKQDGEFYVFSHDLKAEISYLAVPVKVFTLF